MGVDSEGKWFASCMRYIQILSLSPTLRVHNRLRQLAKVCPSRSMCTYYRSHYVDHGLTQLCVTFYEQTQSIHRFIL